jgi:hypothetical protein
MVEEDDDLKRPAQEQEERRTTTINFEFHRGLKNSVTTFQPINSPALSPVGAPSTTTQSSGLALSEIQTTKPKESP